MKIDTGKIEGYAEMTAEEKLAALENYEYEIPAPDHSEIQRLKELVSKANSEAADYKKQLRAKLSDDEAKAAQDAEERENMRKELESLRKDKAIGAFQTKFLSLGYDAESAEKAARALQSGDFETVFETQAQFLESAKKAAVAGALDYQPTLSHGSPIAKETQEQVETATLRRSMGLPPDKKG